MISSLTITLSLFYLLVAIIAAAMLRGSTTPLPFKIVVPTAIVVLACATYITLPDMFGYPVETDFASLPKQAELIAFDPHDDAKIVDLWLKVEGAAEPRAYSAELTEDLKKTLRQAQKAKADGARTMLAKVGKPRGKKHTGYTDLDGGDAPYVLLPSAFSLPAKGDAP